MISTYAKSLLSVATVGLLVLGACGKETSSGPMNDTTESMALALLIASSTIDSNTTDSNTTNSNNVTDANQCSALMDTIKKGREAVAATPEWKTFAATPQWQQVDTDGKVLRKLHCKHNDPLPSQLCTTMEEKIKEHFALAQATPEYKACTELTVWQDLDKSYAEARAAGCLPSQKTDTPS